MNKYINIINKFKNIRILIIGDLILDRYIKGSVSRISQEAPVPIVLEEDSFYTPGGAANVAQNLSSLGARVIQVGKVGNDHEAKIIKAKLKSKNINIKGVFTDNTVPTITKTRVIAQHQQIVRIDKEKVNGPTSSQVNKSIFKFIEDNITDCDAVIISDYGKGMINSELVSFVCDLALKNKTIITVDPKVEHFGYYRGVTAITPNKKETENAIRNIKIREKSADKLEINNDKLESFSDIKTAGRKLLSYLGLESLLITLGEKGMVLFEKESLPYAIDTKAKEVFDVSGAGDTVISVFTLALAAGATKKQAAELSNYAAGVVVGKMGAVAITKEELVAALLEGCKQ